MHQSIAELCNNSNTYFHEYILRIPSTLRCFCTGFDLFSEYCFEDHSYCRLDKEQLGKIGKREVKAYQF